METNEETIILKVKRTNWMYFNEILELFLVLLYFLYLWLIVGFEKDNIKTVSLAVIPFIVLWIILFFIEVIKDFSVELVITDKRVYGKTGFLKVKRIDIPLNEIDNISIEQDYYGKLCKYGDITLELKGETVLFKALRKPFIIKDKLNELTNKTE